jgi:hypothetical protein
MNLTFQMKLSISIGIVGAATSAYGALGPLMTSSEILIGTVALGFVSASLAVVATVTSTQTAQVQQVRDMPGVTRVSVNENASPALAALAVDPAEPKIGPASPEVRPTLVQKAAS